MAHSVFIGHATEDIGVAKAICAHLEAAGLSCWLASRDVSPGHEYGASIVDAINGCSVFVLVFSSYANQSPHVRREVERAVSKCKRIVQFRIDATEPTGAMEYGLSNTQWLNAIGQSMHSALLQLYSTALAAQQELTTLSSSETTARSVSVGPPMKSGVGIFCAGRFWMVLSEIGIGGPTCVIKTASGSHSFSLKRNQRLFIEVEPGLRFSLGVGIKQWGTDVVGQMALEDWMELVPGQIVEYTYVPPLTTFSRAELTRLN